MILDDFGHEFLVSCPGCSGGAIVRPIGREKNKTIVRLSCTHCGLARERQQNWYRIGEAIDPYFQLPLWLQTRSCGQVLWAYNWEHLDFLAAYVAAKDRGSPHAISSWGPETRLASRLPRWLKLAHHRSRLLKAIGQLQAKAPVND